MNKARRWRLLAVCLVVFALLVSAGCADPGNGPDEEAPVDPGDAFVVQAVDAPPVVDGTPEGYPGAPFQVAGMEGNMVHDGEAIYLFLQSETGGWLSAGFNREGGGMDGANMIIGFVQEDGARVRNDLGRGKTHEETTDGIIEGVFVEGEEGVALEFSYPLVFPAEPDFNLDSLETGEVYTLILAFQASSQDPDQRHSRWGRLEFSLE